MNLAVQMARQCAVLTLPLRRGLGLRLLYRSHRLCSRGFEPFQLKFELFDLAMKLLRLASEVHALQLRHDQLQMFNFSIETCHQRLHGRSIQCVHIGRRRGRIEHDLTMP